MCSIRRRRAAAFEFGGLALASVESFAKKELAEVISGFDPTASSRSV